MRNIRLFDEYNDFLAIQEALSGSGKYVEDIFPGFVYTRDKYSGDTYAYYNGHEIEDNDYHFGDVVYDDGTGVLKKVYWSEYTPSMGQKVGLIVVPTSHAADGNARMIAFENAINTNPEPSEPTVNSSNPKAGNELLFGVNTNSSEDYIFPCIGMDNYGMLVNGVLCWDIPGEDKKGEVTVKAGNGTESNYIYYIPYDSNVSLSSDMAPTTGSGVILNPMSPNERYLVSRGGAPRAAAKSVTKDGDTLLGAGTMDFSGQYYDEGIYLSVSPYLEDGTQNPNYVEPEWRQQLSIIGTTVNAANPETRGGDVLLGDPVNKYAINAFADWNGYGNTAALAQEGEYSSVGALDYSCVGTNKGDWYVGAMGEMGYVSSRMWAIRYIMNQLGGDDLLVPGSKLSAQIFTSSVYSTGGTYKELQLGVRTLLTDNGGFLASTPRTEEYPGEIPSVPSTSSFMLGLAYNQDASVRPMAMIKDGQIQHGEAPVVPPFEPET